MSAPRYVPQPKYLDEPSYESPPRRPESWEALRPADLRARQPVGPDLGIQGSDQGYALKLAERFEGQLDLHEGEQFEDVVSGCLGIALKRAASYGRSPVIDDLRVAFNVFGFLGGAPDDLFEFRRLIFEEVSNPYHYVDRSRIVGLVPEATVRVTPAAARMAMQQDWRAQLEKPPAS